jgi:hypothetical protein
MAVLFRTDYDVEICDDEICVRDIYRFADLPYPVRDALHRWPGYRTVRWRSPDGCTWLIRPVLG